METASLETKIPVTPFKNRFLIRGLLSGKNTWWYYVLGLCICALAYLLFQNLLAIPLMAVAFKNGYTMDQILVNPEMLFNAELLNINKNIMLALLLGMFVCTFFGLLITLRFVHKKTLLSITTAFERVRWSRYFFSFTIWGFFTLLFIGVSYVVAPEEVVLQFNLPQFLILFVVSVCLIPIQTATEELLFRGYLMQGIGLAFKNAIAPLIITSLLFGLMHMSNPETKAHGWLIMLPYYTSFGLFLGMLTLLDEGLELAMGIHTANNLISSLLITSKNSVLQTDAIFYSTTENPSGEFVAWLLMASVCFGILYWKYRWTNFKLILR